MPAELTHHAAFVNDVRLHYVRAGSGDPVVLLHGWPQTWYMWRKIIPALAEHYTVIAPDLRGFGESSKPIDGYALKDAPEIYGDAIAEAVRWKGGNNVGKLAGMPVRLRFVMKDADLYAIQFTDTLP